jgi:alpha-mannosidase
VSFEDVGDAGDLYTHSPTGSPITTAWFVDARLVHRGPLRGEVECRWRMRVPAALRREEPGEPLAPRAPRAGRPVEIPITLRFVLDAGAEHVGMHVDGTNAARDHRLRVLLATGIEQGAVYADAAFALVERRPLEVAPEDAARELPPPTAPLHRYVSLFAPDRGVTLFSDGLAEYEALADGRIAVTLVRAVGELSRNDLPERPGHAGWPMPTPEGQCPGPFAARLALLAHGARTAATIARVEQAADDVLLPLTGTTLRSALAHPAPSLGAELAGAGLAFGALKESEEGDAVVARCVNLTDASVAGRWRFGFPVRRAQLARLDETPLGPAAVDAAGDVTFTAGPHAVVTILVECRQSVQKQQRGLATRVLKTV